MRVLLIEDDAVTSAYIAKGLRAEGEYGERDEAGGRRDAIKRIVNDMVEGAQSQW